ncbi:MAG: hypothetical protein ACFFCV_12385 [Promethearchaeota archaeon]
MPIGWDIGKDAQELDESPLLERLKLNRSSKIKIIIALFFYCSIMILFYFTL